MRACDTYESLRVLGDHLYKISAAAKVDDRGHNRHGPKTGRAPFRRRELGPRLTQCRWAEPYLRIKWHLDPSSRLATIDMGENWGS